MVSHESKEVQMKTDKEGCIYLGTLDKVDEVLVDSIDMRCAAEWKLADFN